MRTSMIGAAFLLVGAGAATVAAVDTTGNNIALNGSDTLLDVTRDVITSCTAAFPDFASKAITYQGGGSGTAAIQMQANNQQLGPMSRALRNTEYCSGLTAPGNPGLAAGLLVGIDGVSLLANTVTSCTETTAVANGFGKTTAFNVTSDGTATGTPMGTYTFTDSYDAIKVLFFGLTNDAVYNCNSATRKSLVKNWTNLFSADCAAGDGTCAAGLTHAWRRSDLSGTTDAFLSVLGLPGSRAIGTIPGVPGANTRVNPFCNSVDHKTLVASIGGSSDFADEDDIRTPCGATGSADNVCGYTGKMAGATGAGAFRGDLGLVLPIFLPDAPNTLAADYYNPNTPCTNTCIPIAPIASALLPNGYKCPDGTSPLGGYCYMPTSTSGDAKCLASNQTRCITAASQGNPDGRRYNNVVLIPPSQISQTAFRASSPYQFAFDAQAVFATSSPKYNPRFMTGSFYRIHEWSAPTTNVPVAGTDGRCRENDDSSQIGCLVDSDPCSVGFAGRVGAKLFPAGTSKPLKGLAVKVGAAGAFTPPFTPAPDPADTAILNLLNTGAGPFYPIARRLYVNTVFGFGNLVGGEDQLARCYANNSIIGPIMTARGFVPVPGGVQCIDYPEEGTSTASPAVNTRGAGAVAFPGCNLSLAAHNSCTTPAEAPAICGDGVLADSEGCDDGNVASGDGCSATCTVEGP